MQDYRGAREGECIVVLCAARVFVGPPMLESRHSCPLNPRYNPDWDFGLPARWCEPPPPVPIGRFTGIVEGWSLPT